LHEVPTHHIQAGKTRGLGPAAWLGASLPAVGWAKCQPLSCPGACKPHASVGERPATKSAEEQRQIKSHRTGWWKSPLDPAASGFILTIHPRTPLPCPTLRGRSSVARRKATVVHPHPDASVTPHDVTSRPRPCRTPHDS
jgi:hypothetical protein